MMTSWRWTDTWSNAIATVTFNFTNAQSTRIDQARALYNAANGTSLTAKAYLLALIKDDVRSRLLGDATDAAVIAAVAAAQGQIDTDLAGNA